MSLIPLPYIVQAGLPEKKIVHKWNDDDPDAAYLKPDEPLRNRIDLISGRGIFALSLGIAEWIYWRFEPAKTNEKVIQLIEGMWAAIVDWRYVLVPEGPSWSEWKGPIRGPLCGASILIKEIQYLLETDQPCSLETVNLYRLALHVLPDQKPFKDWLRFVIDRLSKTDRRKRGNYLGSPVPRAALDPEVDYSAKQSEEFLAAFLRGLDPKKNPFLASPAIMKEDGFPGKPYQL